MRDEYEPFPVQCLPAVIADLVSEASTSIGCDPAYVGLAALVATAGATGNRYRFAVKDDWEVPAVLWGAIVGESGTQKSPAIDVAVKPIVEYEAYSRGRSANDPPPAGPKRVLVSDITFERIATLLNENPQGILSWVDELAGHFDSQGQYKRGKGADEAWLLSMFDARSFQRDRQSDREAVHVARAAVSIIGGVQPGVLRRLLDFQRFESGMAARWLLVMPPQRKRAWNEQSIQPETAQMYAATIQAILKAGNPDGIPILLRMSPDAKREWIKWFNKHGERQHRATGNELAMLSKIEGYAARLALIHHVASFAAQGGIEKPIGVESIEAATCLADWFADEAIRVYARLSESETERKTRMLLELIRKRLNGVTPRDLQRARPKQFLKADDAEAALKCLKEVGLLRSEFRGPASKGGRPTVVYFLNDKTTQPTEPIPSEAPSAPEASDTTLQDSADLSEQNGVSSVLSYVDRSQSNTNEGG